MGVIDLAPTACSLAGRVLEDGEPHAGPLEPYAGIELVPAFAKPLSVPAEGGMDEAVQEAARQFAALLEGYIRRYPAEWRDWKNLKLPA